MPIQVKKFFRGLWERYQRGYVVIALLLLAFSVALTKSRGAVVGVVVFMALAIGLELLYREVRSLSNKNNHKWWAKPRHPFVRAYGAIAAMILFVLIESEFARYWLIATAIGAVLVAMGIHFHRTYEDN